MYRVASEIKFIYTEPWMHGLGGQEKARSMGCLGVSAVARGFVAFYLLD